MRKKLILLVISTALTLMLFVFATYAWIKTNIDSQSNGPRLNASTSANIIIFSTPQSVQLNNQNYNPFVLQLAMPEAHTVTRFTPATHTWDDDTSPTLLKYASEVTEIAGDTGLKSSVGELTFDNVIENENSRFYVDYTFYLSAFGKKINGGTLYAYLLNEKDRTTYFGASTIDFYVNDVYKDTLNVAGYDAQINNYTTEKDTLNLGTYDFPYYNSPYIVKIMLRCYFDGALLISRGYTFVTKEAIKNTELTQIDLNVQFRVDGGTEEK